jgi:hypothetical protein
MRVRRTIASVLLTAFVSGFGLPWVSAGHRFNDDIDGEFIQTRTSSGVATFTEPDSGTPEHCLACHWLRSIRTASRPAGVAPFQLVLILIPPVASGPSLRSVAGPIFSARGPPASAL